MKIALQILRIGIFVFLVISVFQMANQLDEMIANKPAQYDAEQVQEVVDIALVKALAMKNGYIKESDSMLANQQRNAKDDLRLQKAIDSTIQADINKVIKKHIKNGDS